MAKRVATKKKPARKSKGLPEGTCLLIQWGELHVRNGKPACPRCGKPAEQIIAFMGEPGWAHKI